MSEILLLEEAKWLFMEWDSENVVQHYAMLNAAVPPSGALHPNREHIIETL